jgi:hypothetical protein
VWVEAAEQPPQRGTVPARAEIPQSDVDGGDRERLGAAAAAVVQRPPHRLPQRLDALGVAPDQQGREVPGQERVDGEAARAHRVGVADALAAVGITHARGDELEIPDRPVRAVGQRNGQRDAVVVGLEVADGGHGVPGYPSAIVRRHESQH